MKKSGLIVLVILITSIALVFSKNIKANTQGQNHSLNQSVYDFLNNEGNRKDVYAAAIELNQGSSANTCVYFISEVLRRNNLNVPKETSNIEQIIPLLEKKGLKKQRDYKKLTPGDICFTTDSKGDRKGIPTHIYVFMKWVKDGSYDYAYICDNQAKDYSGKIYHIRNINVIDKSNGYEKDAFAFFME